MITISETVSGALAGVCGNVRFFFPQSRAQLPAVTWRESGNREFARADGREHLAELEYTVDVWSKSPAENAAIAARIDGRMLSLRLRREYSADLYDTAADCHHRCMRYRCVADGAGNIYQ